MTSIFVLRSVEWTQATPLLGVAWYLWSYPLFCLFLWVVVPSANPNQRAPSGNEIYVLQRLKKCSMDFAGPFVSNGRHQRFYFVCFGTRFYFQVEGLGRNCDESKKKKKIAACCRVLNVPGSIHNTQQRVCCWNTVVNEQVWGPSVTTRALIERTVVVFCRSFQ